MLNAKTRKKPKNNKIMPGTNIYWNFGKAFSNPIKIITLISLNSLTADMF